ncbi:hypothetical protein J4Q44_G00125050 [Coregonus suidteri]|uniref:Uncharacterized protein n=1 Tax=Coregonus suidteri TaxID=861788 RepID=A0AAN8QUH8_9TELE
MKMKLGLKKRFSQTCTQTTIEDFNEPCTEPNPQEMIHQRTHADGPSPSLEGYHERMQIVKCLLRLKVESDSTWDALTGPPCRFGKPASSTHADENAAGFHLSLTPDDQPSDKVEVKNVAAGTAYLQDLWREVPFCPEEAAGRHRSLIHPKDMNKAPKRNRLTPLGGAPLPLLPVWVETSTAWST